jgi:hypothetical protein
MAIDRRTQNAIFISVVSTTIIVILGFTYKNASLPRQDAEIKELQLNIKELTSKQNADQLEKVVMKEQLKSTKESLDQLTDKVEKGFQKVMEQLIENNRNNNVNESHSNRNNPNR